jgi:hypothetical protein
MKHNREKDLQRVIKRRKLWDYFHWGYFGQPNRLWKQHWLKDNCSMCQWMRWDKYLTKKHMRAQSRKIIQEELNEWY